MNKLHCLENKIKNSKCQITKNFLYYLIAPVVILIAGIILLCTVGFNCGVDFAGGSTFTLYVNNGGECGSAAKYDVDEDYDIICDKIENILSEENFKIEYIQKTQIDAEGSFVGGDAVKVVFLNRSSDIEQIEKENEALRNRILAEFGYATHGEAMLGVDVVEPTLSIGYAIAVVGAVIFAITVASIYMMLRTRSTAWAMTILVGAVDILLTGSLLLICRIPLDATFAAVIGATGFVSLFNVFCFFKKANNNIENGLYEKFTKSRMADATVKDLMFKKSAIYVLLAVAAVLLTIIPVNAVRFSAVGIFVMLIASYYNANFILPAIWSATYKEKKKSK